MAFSRSFSLQLSIILLLVFSARPSATKVTSPAWQQRPLVRSESLPAGSSYRGARQKRDCGHECDNGVCPPGPDYVCCGINFRGPMGFCDPGEACCGDKFCCDPGYYCGSDTTCSRSSYSATQASPATQTQQSFSETAYDRSTTYPSSITHASSTTIPSTDTRSGSSGRGLSRAADIVTIVAAMMAGVALGISIYMC